MNNRRYLQFMIEEPLWIELSKMLGEVVPGLMKFPVMWPDTNMAKDDYIFNWKTLISNEPSELHPAHFTPGRWKGIFYLNPTNILMHNIKGGKLLKEFKPLNYTPPPFLDYNFILRKIIPIWSDDQTSRALSQYLQLKQCLEACKQPNQPR